MNNTQESDLIAVLEQAFGEQVLEKGIVQKAGHTFQAKWGET